MRVRIRRLLSIRDTVALVSGVCGLVSASLAAGPPLPVPCAPGACGAAGATRFVTAGAATAVATPTALTVNQTSDSAVLNWASFDIGKGGTVTFKQPSAASIALNRIYQGNPSQIFGSLNANGQIYLVNLNGFLFGSTATVNVGSLLASSLPLRLTDANFSNGILSPLQQSGDAALGSIPGDATQWDPLAPGGRTYVLDMNGNPVLDASGKQIPVQITVQPGAQITAADQGRLLLAGQSVVNGGSLAAPDGQVILAAGTSVYIAASSDPTLRGLVVEVDGTGTVSNQLTGALSSARGNIDLVGLAVNQDGRISATTSVSANGSVRLEAANTHYLSSGGSGNSVSSTQGGTLTLGPDSQIDVLPELASSDTAVQAQTQYPSSVTLLGEQVILQGGTITAPNANLTAIAAANPAAAASIPSPASHPNVIAGVSDTVDPNARLRIDPGTQIDLSGSSTTLPVAANLVSAQLRSSELADDPTQRNGALHGLTVYVDARDPPAAQLANVSGEIAAIPQTIAQRTETGGQATFQSEGDISFANGAGINVSGGSTTYVGGVMQTSYLVGANGQLYPIATANPLLTYTGVLNPTFTQTYNSWGVQDIKPTPGLSEYQPGYIQGASAGTVQFAAPAMVLQGTLEGSAVNGLYQRTPGTNASGGQLIIGMPAGAGASAANNPLAIDYWAPPVRLSASPAPVIVSDDASLPTGATVDLPSSYLTGSGFTSTQIYTNYGVTLPANTPLQLPGGSTLAVDATRVDILSSIVAPGGTLSFQNVFNAVGVTTSAAAPDRPGVYVGDGATLDVRGSWTNDMPGTVAVSQTWQNGGTISLGTATNGALLSIGNDVTLHASGGAWLDAKGALTAGSGGSLLLNENSVGGGFDLGNNVAIDGFGVNGAAGGTFDLVAPRVEIVGVQGAWAPGQQVDDALAPGDVFQLRSGVFSNAGFQTIGITASGLVASGASSTTLLSVDPGTSIDATVSSLMLNANPTLRPSAENLSGLATVGQALPSSRPVAALAFNAEPPAGATQSVPLGATTAGDVVIGAGASITTGAGGSIELNSLDSIIVNGTLRAPGGEVSLHIVQPDDSFEAGFLANQRIEIGSAGVIDVSGTFVGQPSSSVVDLGKAYAGGSVNLLADRGAVVADTGSSLLLAGISAPLDVLQADGAYGHEVAATAGGSLTVHSGEAISLLGVIDAHAGSAGSSGAAAAGSLDLALTRSEGWWGVSSTPAIATFNAYPLTIEVLPATAGLAPSSAGSNRAELGAASLTQFGFDSVRLEAGDVVDFSGALSLALNRQLVIDAPIVATSGGAHVNLAAPYTEVGYDILAGNANGATGGTGALQFSGAEIDLVGNTVFQGTSAVTFASTGDLLLRGLAYGTGADTFTGSVTVSGSLTLAAARIYPTTGTQFAIDADAALGAAGQAIVTQNGVNPGAPLSVGGSIAITADQVNSSGTLYAPFGTISLNANDKLTLGDGSTTSVSGTGLIIPYGQTQYGGQQWLYAAFAGDTSVAGVPSRAVNLTAPNVTIAKNATIDLSGGGDLAAYEWSPGSGGSVDVLQSASSAAAGLYSILPSTLGQASPRDPLNAAGSPIPSGASVYLSGGNGLAGGYYPLLPARYALEPGAFLIQVEPQLQSIAAGSLGALADGTPVQAGFLSYGSTGLHQTPGYIGFAIHPGSYANQLAQYDISLASAYFSSAATAAGTARPTLPADAGSLAINVTTSLNAAGQVLTQAASGGLAAPIEISANDLLVGTPTGIVPGDAVTLAGSVLANWHPGSLLLGGVAIASANGIAVDVLANTVTIGAGTTLAANQVVLVANQSIEVQNGATVESTSAATGNAPSVAPAAQVLTLTAAGSGPASGNGSPAILAVSDLNWLIPQQTGSASGGATLSVDAGASVASRGSLSFNALGGVTLNGAASGVGAAWSLGSASIALDPLGVGSTDTLAIGSGLLGQLAAAGEVRLASTGAIDLLGPVTLGVANGSPTLQSLTLQASTLNNLAGSSGITEVPNSQFGAQTLTLEGVTAASPSAASLSTTSPGAAPVVAGSADATLSLVADALNLGPSTLTVNGFGATHVAVSGTVAGQGTGSLTVGGDLSISAALVTVAAGADTRVQATGALAIAPSGTAALPPQAGGQLTLGGAGIDVSGVVSAPSGNVFIDSSGSTSVASGATVSTAGVLVSIGNQTVGTPGGVLAISSAGDLALSAGAILDVSGAGAAAGGSLSLSVGDSATIGSTLKGSGAASAGGGRFSVDAVALSGLPGRPNPLTSLATLLGAGGFTSAIAVRTHTGDLDLDSASSLSANTVSLTADSGQITVGGTITADSGALRGAISLFGGTGVELLSGGALHADGLGAAGIGGRIEIGSGALVADQAGVLDTYNSGTIRLDGGGTISTLGTAGAGTLLLRAPALISGNDVGIASLASDVSGVGQITIEPVLPFNAATFASAAPGANSFQPTAADFSQIQGSVDQFMSAAAGIIAARLATTVPLSVEAGVEIIVPGSLTLASSDGVSPVLDLSGHNPSSSVLSTSGPVDLTIRAAGDLMVQNTLSDGIADQVVGGTMQPVLLQGPSSSIRLVAGADLTSANPLAVAACQTSCSTGSLTLGTAGNAALVRTGTGDIDLVAAQNIQLLAGSGAYTAGTPAIAPLAGATAATPYPGIPTQLGSAFAYGVRIPKTGLLMSFPAGGGDLDVSAGGNIINDSTAPAGSVPEWQLREGGTTYLGTKTVPPEWGVNLNAYEASGWNFATLGGGDLRLSAGGNAGNLSLATADSLLPGALGAPVYVRGGGLTVTAGGDIGSPQVFVADGRGSITAGGALTAILPTPTSDAEAGAAFYLQSSVLEVTARLGMAVDEVLNPTSLGQPVAGSLYTQSSFFSYSPTAALNLQSLSGDIVFGQSKTAYQTLLGQGVNGADSLGASVLPGTFTVAALGGNIALGLGLDQNGPVTLFPAAQGQLNFVASQNILGAATLTKITMSDAPPGSYATVATPLGQTSVTAAPFSGDIHGSDSAPALLTAGGSISEMDLSIPKAATLLAGEDITDLNYFGQNLGVGDQTVLMAGRDFTYSQNSSAAPSISVGGPGALDILAGRNITLGFSDGVATTGNLLNANLPTAQGANITMVAGLGTAPDFVDFATKIIAPSAAYQTQLIAYVESLQESSNLSFGAADSAFQALAPDLQRPFIDQVFFDELQASGRAATATPAVGFSEGYAAIDALFPGSRTTSAGAAANAYSGDLTLSFSRIYTLSGGDIDLLVPGGLLNVGLANAPSILANRDPSTLGIVAEGTGNVDIYTRNDVDVNASRIFTLGGGNILIWSDEGSIDAGRGAKTAVSAPPPTVLINSNGTISLDFSGAASGSGIRTIQTEPTTPPGNVDLIAPVGTVNAGDAGIGSAGNINIAAASVIGVSNINFGGTATGVPALISSVGASLSGASAAATSASNTATAAVANNTAEKDSAAPLSQAALSWLDVFVTGLGEENCKPDDIECLKRQRTTH